MKEEKKYRPKYQASKSLGYRDTSNIKTFQALARSLYTYNIPDVKILIPRIEKVGHLPAERAINPHHAPIRRSHSIRTYIYAFLPSKNRAARPTIGNFNDFSV